MKTSTKRTLSKSLSIFLAILMIICAIPMSSFAHTDSSEVTDNSITSDNAISAETPATDTEVAEEKPYVLGEVESLRTETAKHFRMSDGSYVAVEYGKAVHFQDDSGKWKDFDNTLSVLKTDKTDDLQGLKANKLGYKSSKNDVKFEFANNTNSSSLVKIRDDKFNISLDLIGSTNKSITINNTKEKVKSEKPTIEEASELTDYSSSVTYTDILANTDIEYILYGDNLKENIIVKAKSDNYVYEFELNTNGLIPKLNEDGSISLVNDETGEAEYTIPAGYMFDANGETSNAVKYSLKQNKNGTYILVVTADASWINADERAFPVTIDPTIIKDTAAYIKDTYVTSSSPSSSFGTNSLLYVSGQTADTCITYMGMDLYPDIPRYAVITDAKFSICLYNKSSTGDTYMGVYAVKSAWSDSTTYNTIFRNKYCT